MKSVMEHSFARTPSVEIQRSSFDRSHGHKTTFDIGYLVPIYVDEALPGDTFNMSMSAFARLATPIYPIMDNMYMDVHFFSIPIRQLWDNWRKFCGEQIDPTDSIDFVVPKRNITVALANGTFEDYLGLPFNQTFSYSALFHRAYLHVFNEWYRDQNLQNSEVFSTGDADVDGGNGTNLLKRCKRHDYFTSCLPWPQKGDDVLIPISGSAALQTNLSAGGTPGIQSASGLKFLDADGALVDVSNTTAAQGDLMFVNLGSHTSTINDLREAFQIQRLLERDARGGTRYAELIKSHFGVQFDDVTYRPEFLGGGSFAVNINPVAQTSSTDATTPQGNLAAFGTAGANNIGFNKSFNEHCIILGIVSARADITYQQGINRMFSRSTRYDFYWPSLSNIGEQAVLNKEIFLQGTADDDNVFGYQERYGEYRYKPSIITGKMRSDATGTLDAWHLSEDFASLPSLNASFIQDSTPLDRCIEQPTEPHFIFDSHFNLRCARPMPLFGTPGMTDRF